MTKVAANTERPRKPYPANRKRATPVRTSWVSRRTRAGRRIQHLIDTYQAALADRELSPALLLKVEMAAEASVVAEDARARFLNGDASITLDNLVRADRRAASAVAALRIKEDAKSSEPIGLRAYEAAVYGKPEGNA
jgi:hypothetical protein